MKSIVTYFLILFSNMVSSQTINELLELAEKNRINQNYHATIKNFDEAIEIDQNNCSYLFYMRAIYKQTIKDLTGAISDYSAAINGNSDCKFEYMDGMTTMETIIPSISTLYLNRGLLRYSINDFHNCIMDMTRVLSYNNKFEDAIYYRALAKNKLKDYRGAMSDFNNVLLLNPNYTIVFLERGKNKFDMKDYEGAIADFSKRITLYKDDCGEEYYLRGLAKLALGKTNEGCSDLSKAGEAGISQAYETIQKYCN